MIEIDGSVGEGGGQILRTALSLSMVTGTPFRMLNIRKRRERPGLARQHLAAVEAARKMTQAEVEGASPGSLEITFRPGRVESGRYRFSIGTAGSTTLVLETILPALMIASGPSEILLEGGTHNPMAPPFDFVAKTFLPLLNRMGPRITALLERPGFYPRGGGKISVEIEPAECLEPLELLERGPVIEKRGCVLLAGLARSIAERESRVLGKTLGLRPEELSIKELDASWGPGNVVMVEVQSTSVREIFVSYGTRGVPAEMVAEKAAREVLSYMEKEVPVGPYLADQLLLPLAMAGGGAFKTAHWTSHAATNAEIIRRFLAVRVDVESVGNALLVKIRNEGAEERKT